MLIIIVIILFILAGVTIDFIVDDSVKENAQNIVEGIENQDSTMVEIKEDIRSQIEGN